MLDTKDEVIQNLQKAIQLSSSYSKIEPLIIEIKFLYDDFKKFSHSSDLESASRSFGNHFLESLRKYSGSLISILTNRRSLNRYLKIKLKNRIMKIKVIISFLPLAYSLHPDDFRCLNDDHPRKLAIKSITRTTTLEEQSIKNQSNLLLALLDSGKASIMNYLEYKKSNLSYMLTGFNMLYYLYYPKERKMYNRIYEMNETLDDSIAFWNMLNSSLLKKVTSLMHEKILINQLIYVPRLSCHVMDSGKYSQVLSDENFYFADEKEQRVQIRVLSAIPIPSINKGSSDNSKTVEFEFVVIDIHGGGHFAQNSSNHESYSIRWANSLKVPIFALDYRLAPEHKFPEGLDDTWQAYTWLINNLEPLLKIKAKKIVLAGDSAGGTYAIDICFKAKSCGFRQPDGLVCIYPCTNLSLDHISLGMLQSLNDPILPFKLFTELKKHYLNSAKDINHCYVSPIYVNQSLLSGFPKTKFLLSTRDTLYFDDLEFVDRLLSAGVDVEIYEYTGFMHNFLQLVNPQLVPIHEVSFNDSLKALRELGS